MKTLILALFFPVIALASGPNGFESAPGCTVTNSCWQGNGVAVTCSGKDCTIINSPPPGGVICDGQRKACAP